MLSDGHHFMISLFAMSSLLYLETYSMWILRLCKQGSPVLLEGWLCERVKLLGNMSDVYIVLKLREGWKKVREVDTELIGICLPIEGF